MIRYHCIVLGFLFCTSLPVAVNADPCAPIVSRIVSIQGTIEVKRAHQTEWFPVQPNQEFCPGDSIRVEALSRAVLVLRDETLLRLDQMTTLVLPMSQEEDASWLEFARGAVHFISNVRYRLKIRTPFVNAAIEGTEFVVRVADSDTKVWVIEGAVGLENSKGSRHLGPGDAAIAESGKAPVPYLLIKPRDAVQWALYYPPILDYRAEGVGDSRHRSAIDWYKEGRIQEAIAELNAIPAAEQDSHFFTQRAAILLSVGRIESAQADIDRALELSPANAQPLALQSIIALTLDDRRKAVELAERAVRLEPKNSTPWVALSYARQAEFDLEKATESIRKAIDLSPEDSLAWARLSELELAAGRLDEALEAAKKAETLDPKLARTQMVLGFAQLSEIEVEQAKDSFEKAIRFDPAAPFPRLGLGLAKIREGDVEEGRKQIEIAAVLDPENSIIRSYLGKAYYEEKRSYVASREFELAKRLDPKDPTPWFYDAIQLQTINRPIDALKSLHRAIDLNKNRQIYRSRLALDDDRAARSATLGRIYQNLGFEKLAVVEGWKSTNYNPVNYSAHRFLADAYLGQPRLRIAQASELLQAQLLQETNIAPLQPQLAGSNLAVLNASGPSSFSINEYNPLFAKDGASALVNGLLGSNGTWGENTILTGIFGKFSASFGQFHYTSDGFRSNSDYQRNLYDALLQWEVSPRLTLQAEFRTDHAQFGDLSLRLSELAVIQNGVHSNGLRTSSAQDIARLGFHYLFNPSNHFIGSAIYSSFRNRNDETSPLRALSGVTSVDFNERTSQDDGFQLEFQHLFAAERVNTTAGIGYVHAKKRFNDLPHRIITSPVFFDDPKFDEAIRRNGNSSNLNGYFYLRYKLFESLSSTVGISVDSYNDLFASRNQINPKFGLIWNPVYHLTIRAAAFRTLKRALLGNQTIEPTQVGGFNQFFDDFDGTRAWRYGIGVDYKISDSLFSGVEVSWRKTNQLLINNNSASAIGQNRNEAAHSAYVNWTPTDWLTFSAEYRFDEFSRDLISGQGNLTVAQGVRTQTVPIGFSLFGESGLFAKFGSTYIDQSANFVNDSSLFDEFSDSFWLVDAGLGYRLPKRYGVINFEVRNILDTQFNYQSNFDAGAVSVSQYVPERQFFLNLRLSLP